MPPSTPTHSTRFPKTLAFLEDVGTLRKAFDTAEGAAYYCPFCYDKERKYGVPHPKPDTSGKLHINAKKQKGYCFRCDTALISRKDYDSLKSHINDFLNSDEELIDLQNLPVVDLSSVPPASKFGEAIDYLKSRNSFFNEQNADKFDLRWVDTYKMVNHCIDGVVKLRRKGIMLPLKYHGQIRSYQIRYITDSKSLRFHTMEGKRLLGNIADVKPYSPITLCEGFYDAVALNCMGFPNPVAILGKSLSALQMAQLQELTPCHVNLCLDEPSLNYGVLRGLRKKLKTAESYKSWKFKNAKDPEDFLRSNPDFRYNLDGFKLFAKNIGGRNEE